MGGLAVGALGYGVSKAGPKVWDQYQKYMNKPQPGPSKHFKDLYDKEVKSPRKGRSFWKTFLILAILAVILFVLIKFVMSNGYTDEEIAKLMAEADQTMAASGAPSTDPSSTSETSCNASTRTGRTLSTGVTTVKSKSKLKMKSKSKK